jgi:hypothetical protein
MTDPRFPDRPDHADFWKLSRIILYMDADAETYDGFERLVDEAGVDHRSLSYVAMQRALRSHGGDISDPDAVVRTAAVWIDGFITGNRYSKERT